MSELLEHIKAFDPLVEERGFKIDAHTIFVTISPNPKVPVEYIVTNKETRKKRTMRRPYGMLRQDEQYKYCKKVLQSDYIESLSKDCHIVGVAELNKTGNIHFHLLINDITVRNDVQLQVLRRDILNSVYTTKNIRAGSTNGRDYMNNIVFVTESEASIRDYFMKDQESMLPRFPNYSYQ